MAKFEWKDFLNQAGPQRVESSTHGSGRSETELRAEHAELEGALYLAAFFLLPPVALLANELSPSLVTHSPILNVLGGAGCFVGLLCCLLAGGLWWMLTGSKALCVWASTLLPFAVQPYRAIVGVLLLSLCFMYLMEPLLRPNSTTSDDLKTAIAIVLILIAVVLCAFFVHAILCHAPPQGEIAQDNVYSGGGIPVQ